MLRFVALNASEADEVLLGHQIPVIDIVFDAVDGGFHDTVMRTLCGEENFVVELGSEDRKRVTVLDELALDGTDVFLVEVEDSAALHGFELSDHAGLLVFRVLHIDGPRFVYAYNIGIFMRILNPKTRKSLRKFRRDCNKFCIISVTILLLRSCRSCLEARPLRRTDDQRYSGPSCTAAGRTSVYTSDRLGC